MMSSPSVVRETRGTASTVSNHARTLAVNGRQQNWWCEPEPPLHDIGCNTSCRLPFSAACPTLLNERQTKAKTWKGAFQRWETLVRTHET